MVFNPGEFSVNASDPTQETYAILDQLEHYRGKDGLFNFKLVWPQIHGRQHWKQVGGMAGGEGRATGASKPQRSLMPSCPQTSNPATTVGKITGYVAIDVVSTDDGWAGLAADTQNALIDGRSDTAGEESWGYSATNSKTQP